MLLRRAWYGLNQAFRHLAAQSGLTPDQFTVLRTLREHEAFRLTQSALAEQISSDPNTIASLLRRMEQQGLIERCTSAVDRRAHSLALRPAGQRRYNEVRRRAVALQKRVLGALPEPRRESFLAQLQTISDACRQAAEIGRLGRRSTGPRARNRQLGLRRKAPLSD
jgi:DNA-binding MarR family transcriptional regulator